MYIEPNSTIKILKNVPLDPTYDHTVWFDSEDEQPTWFNHYVKYELTEQSYQRTRRGYMRIRRRAEDLYDCNYIMYRNINFGDKWFYAFLTSVEYINNEVSEVRFEIDVMQTWYYDYKLEESFVEREHTRRDYIGDNIIEETIGTGPIMHVADGRFAQFFQNDNYYYIIATTQTKGDSFEGNWSSADGEIINSMYNGVKFIVYTEAENINHDLKIFTDDQKSDCIVSIFMFPKSFVTEIEGGYQINKYGPQVNTAIFGTTTESPQATAKPIFWYINSSNAYYIPRNNKLYTYPFAYITIVSSDGDNAEYKRESFGNPNNIQFKFEASMTPNPEYICFPINYNHMQENRLNSTHVNTSPQCAYTIDGYRAWLAQRKYTLPVQYATGIGVAVASLVKGTWTEPGLHLRGSGGKHASANGGDDVGAGFGAGIGAVANLLATQIQATRLPDTLHNSQSNGLSVANSWFGFHAYNSTISGEYAEIIDDFFDRFGYACRRNKIPERHARGAWTYTKTINCTVTGSVPADDIVKICSIYDHGITFWVHTKTVGDYSQDNSPLGGGD